MPREIKTTQGQGRADYQGFVANSYVNHNQGFVLPCSAFQQRNLKTNNSPAQQVELRVMLEILIRKTRGYTKEPLHSLATYFRW